MQGEPGGEVHGNVRGLEGLKLPPVGPGWVFVSKPDGSDDFVWATDRRRWHTATWYQQHDLAATFVDPNKIYDWDNHYATVAETKARNAEPKGGRRKRKGHGRGEGNRHLHPQPVGQVSSSPGEQPGIQARGMRLETGDIGPRGEHGPGYRGGPTTRKQTEEDWRSMQLQ